MKIGDQYVYCFDGSIDEVADVGPDRVTYREISAIDRPLDPDIRELGISDFLARRALVEAAPSTSQHPADLKPRGVKAPLYLIPWGAVPAEHVPAPIEFAAKACGHWPDGDRYRPSIEVGDFPSELFGALMAGTTLEQVARVFAYGAAKYARDNWRTFTWDQSARDEYFGAICRHLTDGAELDPESGLPHRAHAACGALIWAWHEGQK